MTRALATTPERSARRVGCHSRLPEAELRVVGFAHAGGGPSSLQPLAPHLAPTVELWHVTLPGRGRRRREPFARHWRPLVADLADAVARDVAPPFALLGHSLGALLAFEVARRLTRIGTPPAHLFVSGRPAPELPVPITLPASDDELLASSTQLRGAVPPALLGARDVLVHFLPVLRADLELADAYVLSPGARLDCPITAFTGDADPIAAPAQLAGWASQTLADCELHVLPGGHFSLLERDRDAAAAILSRLPA